MSLHEGSLVSYLKPHTKSCGYFVFWMVRMHLKCTVTCTGELNLNLTFSEHWGAHVQLVSVSVLDALCYSLTRR